MKANIASQRLAGSPTPFTLRMTVAALAGAGLLSSASVWAQDAQVAAEKEQAAAPVSRTSIQCVIVPSARGGKHQLQKQGPPRARHA